MAAVHPVPKGRGVCVRSVRHVLCLPARLLQARGNCRRLRAVPHRHVHLGARRPGPVLVPYMPAARDDAGPRRADQPGRLRV